MRYTVTVLVLALVAAACGADEANETTSTTPETSTSLTTTTSTTIISTTTTTPPPTTTTTEGTTTTTELTGNWAAEPLVVSAYGALGWWDGTSWIRAEDVGTLPVSGGEDYQVVLSGVDEIITGGPEVELCEPLQNKGVELSDPSAVSRRFPQPSGVAISAPWELTPHFVQEEADDGTYSDFARPLLAARGLDVESPVIKQVVRLDLEGDGVNEVVAVAEEITGDSGIYAEEGNYSVVFMRKVVDGEVQTAVLEESIASVSEEIPTPFITALSVAAVADLSGDGKMEVVINGVYYEGEGWAVFEYVNDDLGPVMQIGAGCGV
jgi:hypothetical protein